MSTGRNWFRLSYIWKKPITVWTEKMYGLGEERGSDEYESQRNVIK